LLFFSLTAPFVISILQKGKKEKHDGINIISGFNDAAFVLFVYATQILSPRPLQNSLPRFRWLSLGMSLWRFLLWRPHSRLVMPQK